MCVQFNILDSVLICLPNIWGNYQVWLLSLSPVGPWGGEGTISKMCLQLTFLIQSWQFLTSLQGPAVRGPTVWSPIIIPPNIWHKYQARFIENWYIGVHTHSRDNSCIYVFLYFKSTPKWVGTNIRIEWKMLGCTHIPEIVFSPFPPSLLNRGRRALR